MIPTPPNGIPAQAPGPQPTGLPSSWNAGLPPVGDPGPVPLPEAGLIAPAEPAISVLPALAGAPPFQAAAVVFLPLSGNPLIDGVLFDGRRWASGTLTYSFPDSLADYEWPYGAFNEPTQGGVIQVSARQMQVTGAIYEGTDPGTGLRAYASIESLTHLDFVRAGFNDAVIRIAGTTYPVAPAWTYLPNTNPAGGDTWFLNGTYGYDFTNPVLGDYVYFGHLHEFMHGLGLKDGSFPHVPSAGSPATPPLPAAWDSLEFSINSYRSYVGAPTDGYRNEAYGFPQTPMMLDIAGLQYLYGADFGTQAGDTVYRWNPATGEMAINGVGQGVPGANRIFLTIWDGGGTDTLDLSNYATPLSVDLTPGGWSTLSTAQLAALNASDGHVLARGNVFNALQYQGDPRSLIENATGGPSSDRMLGNVVANQLDARDGQDTLLGGAGNDTLLGDGGADALYGGIGSDRLTAGAGNDRLSGGHGTDSAVFTGNRADYSLGPLTGGTLELRDLRGGAPDGNDTLTGIEHLQFADTLLALGALPSADSPGSAGDNILVWRGQGGEVASWQLNGTQIASTGIVPFNPGASWAIAGNGDFDGDGRPDILWRGLGGEVAVWQMNGQQIVSTGILTFNPGLYWAIAGTGDFDGDLRGDILWRGQGGEVAIWQMNGQQILSTGILPFNPGLYWAIAGTGDFDGDAHADILWRGQGGEVAIWQMNGQQIASTAILPLNPGNYWAIEDTGDFGGDVRSDILWRGQGGEVAIWQMNATQPVSTGGVAFNPGSYWAIEGTGDFDGNGLSDIAWRGQGGEVAIWEMNGTLISSSAILPFNPGNYWDVALLEAPLL